LPLPAFRLVEHWPRHPLRGCSFPGYPASPSGLPAVGPLVSASTTVVTCGLPGHFHAERLGRFVFAVGTRAVPVWPRAAMPRLFRSVVPSLRSPFPAALWLLLCDSPLYLPYHRVCVSLSSGFPRGIRFWRQSFHRGACGWFPAHRSTSGESLPDGYPVPTLRSCCFRYVLSAGFLGSEGALSKKISTTESCPFWTRSLSLFDLLVLTTAQMYIRLRLPWQPACE
jgi:hypothetical protein